MSVLFGAGLLSDFTSGTFWSLQGTLASLAARGIDTTVVGILGRNEPVAPAYSSASVHTFLRRGPPSLYYGSGLRHWLQASNLRPDVVSMHTVWQHTNSVLSRWAVAQRIPRLISPHGGFSPAALAFSRMKKWAARHWFVSDMLANATCFHALNPVEFRHIRDLGLRQPVFIIPNGVLVPPELPPSHGPRHEHRLQAGSRICLYLGRLHPIKNLESLIQAWQSISARYPDWILAIAGGGDQAYQSALESMARGCRPRAPIFLGRLDGDIKTQWLRQAEFLVLPSFSEGLPIAPLEAMAQGTPVLVTRNCQLAEVEDWNAGCVCDATLDSLTTTLEQMLSLPPSALSEMGKNGRSLVSERYSSAIVANQLIAAYRWMRGVGDKPDFCELD